MSARRDDRTRVASLAKLAQALLRGDATALRPLTRELKMLRAAELRNQKSAMTPDRKGTQQMGRQGNLGATGLIGRRGKIGRPGQEGLKSRRAPLNKNDVLDVLVTHFDDVYQQLNEHRRLIARIQQQVDVLIAKLRRAET